MKNSTIFGMFTLEPDFIVDYQFCPSHFWVQMKLKSSRHPDVILSFECDDYRAFLQRKTEIDESLRMDALQLLNYYERVASMKKADRPRVSVIDTKI